MAATIDEKIATLVEATVPLFPDNPWLEGVLTILLTLVIVSLFGWLLVQMLKRLPFVARHLLDEGVARLLLPPVCYTLLATSILAGLDIMPAAGGITSLLNRCVRSIGVVIWGIFCARGATLLLARVAKRSNDTRVIQARTLTLFDNVAKVFILGFSAYAIFVIWKIDMTAWLASAGIAGIAVGFAAKDTLSNLFSGVYILADSPYKVGDYIVLERGDRGKVTHIGLRSTRILTRDDVEITIPNSIIGNTTIINQSGGPYRKLRIRLKVGVAYGTDIDLVRSLLLAVASADPHVCKSPEPRVRFRLFGPSSLDFELLCWVNDPELHGRALDSLNDAVYKSFSTHNIEIPYAKQDLYIKGLPAQLSFKEPARKE